MSFMAKRIEGASALGGSEKEKSNGLAEGLENEVVVELPPPLLPGWPPGTLRWLIVQLLALLVFILVTLKYFQFTALFASDCSHLQLHNVPYCVVVDFILSIVVCLLAVGVFLHHKTWLLSSAADIAVRIWHDYESVYGAVLALFVIAVVAVYAYYMANLAESFRERVDRSPCHQPSEKINGYLSLSKHISEVMEEHHLDYFMDYGTLIGAMRFNGPIPWDHDVDFGLLESSMLEHGVSASQIVDELQDRGFDCYYDMWNGLIRVATPDGIADADLMLWREDMWGNGVMKRVGLEAWLAPIAYSLFNDFPKEYVFPEGTTELPRRKFGGLLLREPVNPIGFLSTRYRSSWWKEVRPAHCTEEKYTVFDGSRPPFMPFEDPEHVNLALAAQRADERLGKGRDPNTEFRKIVLHNSL